MTDYPEYELIDINFTAASEYEPTQLEAALHEQVRTLTAIAESRSREIRSLNNRLAESYEHLYSMYELWRQSAECLANLETWAEEEVEDAERWGKEAFEKINDPDSTATF